MGKVNFDWVQHASCSDTPTDWYFFEKGEGSGRHQQLLLSICNNECPVRDECLQTAMELEEDAPSFRYGIWGGLTPNGRKKLWRKQNNISEQEPSEDKFCERGHALSLGNAYVRFDGYLVCKTCRRDARRAKRLALKESA